MFPELGVVHIDRMHFTRFGLLDVTLGGIPWMVKPVPRRFLLPDSDGPFIGLILEAGTPRPPPPAELLGSADTARLAAALEGSDDIVRIGSRVRYEVSGRTREDRRVHDIVGAHDSEMKRNGKRLLTLIDTCVHESTSKGYPHKLQALIRWFPEVALRHVRVAELLDRMRITDKALLRWFGEQSGRGRPARRLPEERALIGTLEHECTQGPNINAALRRAADTGTDRGYLANLRSQFRELYQLSVDGIWVTADRLMRVPWVAPEATQKRWDVYRVPDVQFNHEENSYDRTERR